MCSRHHDIYLFDVSHSLAYIFCQNSKCKQITLILTNQRATKCTQSARHEYVGYMNEAVLAAQKIVFKWQITLLLNVISTADDNWVSMHSVSQLCPHLWCVFAFLPAGDFWCCIPSLVYMPKYQIGLMSLSTPVWLSPRD